MRVGDWCDLLDHDIACAGRRQHKAVRSGPSYIIADLISIIDTLVVLGDCCASPWCISENLRPPLRGEGWIRSFAGANVGYRMRCFYYTHTSTTDE